MIALIPVFPEDNNEYWDSKQGSALLEKSFRSALEARELDSVYVCTNFESVLSLSRSLGITSFFVDALPKNKNIDSEVLPLGTCSAIELLSGSIASHYDSIMILNFRNLLLTPNMIDDAVRQFRNNKPSVLVSVKQSKDHPCQLNAYYKVLEMSLVLMFDENRNVVNSIESLVREEGEKCIRRGTGRRPYRSNESSLDAWLGSYLKPEEWRVTKSFFFDWAARGITCRDGIDVYISQWNDNGLYYIPVRDASLIDTHNLLWVYDTKETARILLRWNGCKLKSRDVHTEIFHRSVGVGFSENFNTVSHVIFENEGQLLLSRFGKKGDLSLPTGMVRLYRIGPAGHTIGNVAEIELREVSEALSLPWKKKDLHGIICSFLDTAQDDTYDVCESFPHDGKLWAGSKEKINVKTNRKIFGRQNFPDVYELDETLFIAKKEYIERFDIELYQGNADGFLVEESSPIQFGSRLDELQYHVIKERLS